MIDVVHDDAHTVEFMDEAGMSFMALVVHELNRAMKDNGVQNEDARQSICADFLFNLGYKLDAGWFMHDDQKLFPKLCFVQRAEPEADENLGRIRSLLLATEAISLHESTHGVVSQYFEDGEAVEPAIRTGSYDKEDES